MSDGITNELDFEKRIREMPDRQLLEFVARQTFEVTGKCKEFNADIATLKSGDRKASSITGGAVAAITTVIINLINYFIVNKR